MNISVDDLLAQRNLIEEQLKLLQQKKAIEDELRKKSYFTPEKFQTPIASSSTHTAVRLATEPNTPSKDPIDATTEASIAIKGISGQPNIDVLKDGSENRMVLSPQAMDPYQMDMIHCTTDFNELPEKYLTEVYMSIDAQMKHHNQLPHRPGRVLSRASHSSIPAGVVNYYKRQFNISQRIVDCHWTVICHEHRSPESDTAYYETFQSNKYIRLYCEVSLNGVSYTWRNIQFFITEHGPETICLKWDQHDSYDLLDEEQEQLNEDLFDIRNISKQAVADCYLIENSLVNVDEH